MTSTSILPYSQAKKVPVTCNSSVSFTSYTCRRETWSASEVPQLLLHHSRLFPNSEDLRNDCSRAVIFKFCYMEYRFQRGDSGDFMGVRREMRWMEWPRSEALGASSAQGTSVAFELLPLPSSCTTDSGSQPLWKQNPEKEVFADSSAFRSNIHTSPGQGSTKSLTLHRTRKVKNTMWKSIHF